MHPKAPARQNRSLPRRRLSERAETTCLIRELWFGEFQIAQRYEILRTIVRESNTSSQPVQIIDDEAAIDFAELELSDASRAVLNLSTSSIILDGRSLKLLV